METVKEMDSEKDGTNTLMISTSPSEDRTFGLVNSKMIVFCITCINPKSSLMGKAFGDTKNIFRCTLNLSPL